MSLNQTHRQLVRESLRGNNTDNGSGRRKRRKVVTKQPEDPIEVDSPSTDDFDDIDLEDVDLDALAADDGGLDNGNTPRSRDPSQNLSSDRQVFEEADPESGLEFDSDDFDDLEDVDIDGFDVDADSRTDDNETLTFSIKNNDDLEKTAHKKRTFGPILKNERRARKLVHKDMLLSMVCHGAVRNRWCSDPSLLRQLRKIVSQEIVDLFDQDKADVLSYVKLKRFIDGLRKLMAVFSKKFKVSSPGIQRHDWGYDEIKEEDLAKKVPFDAFVKSVKGLRGNRDIGAQAFVAFLRSINVDARLVFSVQVPDFRSIRPVKGATEENKNDTSSQKAKTGFSKPRSEFDPVFIPNAKQNVLSEIRSRRKNADKAKQQLQKQHASSNFPVFWCEVWNKYSKKWVTVDPIVFKVVEVVPMRRKSKFDAPGSDETHQTWYVMAYDRYGTVKDVTRRYTQYYNAKTVKKRIGFGSDKEEHWYNRLLRAASRLKPVITEAEAYELKEFYDRHVCEGTPNNMADFKNHPVYALEPQLRQDEIIYPNDETSKCGTFRSSNKSSIIPVYKRACVYRLKTPKAWHMLGRVLKVGAQPLKMKKASVQFLGEDADDDGQVRLYAEFQTQLYKPPAIVDGKIPKNAYGNVEIFTPTMVPENGYLVPVSDDVSMKMLETAARWHLNIDYAKAIVSFEFGKGQQTKRAPTAKEGGILIDAQYKEGMLAVVEGLKEQQEQERRENVELNALRSWNFFLKKLQIIKRLDRSHGKLATEDDWLEPQASVKRADEDDEDDGYYSVGSEDEISGNENEEGGFFMENADAGNEENMGDYEGGFLPEEILPEQAETDANSEIDGGFLVESDGSEMGAKEGSEEPPSRALRATRARRARPCKARENGNSDTGKKDAGAEAANLTGSSEYNTENGSIEIAGSDTENEEEALGIEYSE